MLSQLLVTALLGLSATASPVANPPSYGGGSSKGQVAFKFPLTNGFPNIKVPSPELTEIQKNAHGTLPNTALPTKINDTSAANLQLIAFNEIFEVAYFSSLLNNVTHGSYGQEIGSKAAKNMVINAIKTVRAQEELHALGANAILASAGRTTIKPCEYIFPVDKFDDAITLAYTFTDVVLGTLQAAQFAFAEDGDAELVPLVGSIIGQEGEQNGYYRSLTGKVPSALPFLTRSAGPFAYSALQMFVVPGSCPSAKDIKLPIFEPLTVMTKNIKLKDQMLTFAVKKTTAAAVSKMSVVYINQQNKPIVEKVQNVKTSGDSVTFQAAFPAATNLMNSLTLSALTTSAGPFADLDAVAAVTKYGPGLIEIN